MKHFLFTIALAFILAGSAFANSAITAQGAEEFKPGFTFSEGMSGLETAAGTNDFEDDVVWGNSITLAGTTSEFTANINRAGIEINRDFGNKIAGGTWTLHVYKGGILRGIIFGEFTGGTIEWVRDRRGNLIAQSLNGTLTIKGGTDEFESVGGAHTSGTISTVSDVGTRSNPRHKGSVNLLF
jgi:hypothetical protein